MHNVAADNVSLYRTSLSRSGVHKMGAAAGPHDGSAKARDAGQVRESVGDGTTERRRLLDGRVIEQHLLESARVFQRTAEICPRAISHTAQLIIDCFQRGGKLLICGNGGSAAESQHMAAEFTHRLSAEVIRRALPAIALTTDTSFLTAFANDDGYERVFARQVEALGRPGDVLLGISTSGNSRNVVAAFRQAHLQDLATVALTGASGEMVEIADAAICIPANATQPIQEAQLAVLHILCALVEQAFVEPAAPKRSVDSSRNAVSA